ncbi:MAG: phosphate ABC transporter substrate-binding protein [Eubacterium sp.]|nr:phosphate ABC transporter substrate-binding protein [Eubacterium sp.]
MRETKGSGDRRRCWRIAGMVAMGLLGIAICRAEYGEANVFTRLKCSIDTADAEASVVKDTDTEAITEEKIGTEAATKEMISIEVVTEEMISIEAITEEKIGTEAITEEMIDTEVVSEEKIGTEAVTEEMIGTEAISEETIGTEPISVKDTNTNAMHAEEMAQTKAAAVIVMTGSTAMEPLANVLAEGFMAANPDVTVTAEFTGSSAGIAAVLTGRADIGNVSRNLREEERQAGAVETVVAVDGIAVITHPTNPVADVTLTQLAAIYEGRIRNWLEVGGADEMIVVVGREAGSGTRCTFEEQIDLKDRCAYANEMDSSGAVMARVAATAGAIGYVSAGLPDDTVRVLALDGSLPTKEQIQTGSYRMSRPLVMVTDGALSRQSGVVQAFFAYIGSEEGRRLVEAVGFVNPSADSDVPKYAP